MLFEYDPEKNVKNLSKHGIDFEQAKKLWSGPFVDFAAQSPFENRFAIIGAIDEKLYACIYTLRVEAIRIISCRRSRKKEKLLYEKNTKKTRDA